MMGRIVKAAGLHRRTLAGLWLLLTLATTSYALIKPSTTAADLVFLPNAIVRWLDNYFNFRTFVMAVAVCSAPACLLAAPVNDAPRRLLLGLACCVLLSLELAQLWIPTRGFSWQDAVYSVAGVICAEGLVLSTRPNRISPINPS